MEEDYMTQPSRQINPLWWGGLAAIGVIASETVNFLRGAYLPRVAIVRLAAFAVALVLLAARSRYAWHAFLIAIVIMTPLTLLNVPPDAGMRYQHPNTIWIHGIFTFLGIALLLKFRRRYFEYLKKKTEDR